MFRGGWNWYHSSLILWPSYGELNHCDYEKPHDSAGAPIRIFAGIALLLPNAGAVYGAATSGSVCG